MSTSRSLISSLLGSLATPLSGVVCGPFLARAMTLDGRGAVAGAVAPLTFALAIGSGGIADGMLYFAARDRSRNLQFVGLGLMTLMGELGTLLICLTSLTFSSSLADSKLLMLAGLTLVPNLIVLGLRGIYMGKGRWHLVAADKYISSLVRIVGCATLFAEGELTPLRATLVLTISPALGAVVYLSAIRNIRTVALGYAENSELIRYARQIWLGSIAGIILLRLDQVLMVPLSTTRELAFYAVAANLGDLVSILAAAVNAVVVSESAAAMDNTKMVRLARTVGWLGIAGTVILALALPMLAPLVFGAGYTGAVLPAQILLFAGASGLPGSIAGAMLSGAGLPKYRSRSLVIAALVNSLALVLLVPGMGATGAALATLLGSLIASNLNILAVQRHMGIPFLAFYQFHTADFSSLAKAGKALVPNARVASS